MKYSILLLILVQLTTWTQVSPNMLTPTQVSPNQTVASNSSQCQLCTGGVTFECGKYYATTEECAALLPNANSSLFSNDPIDRELQSGPCPSARLIEAAGVIVEETRKMVQRHIPRLPMQDIPIRARLRRQVVPTESCDGSEFSVGSFDSNGYPRTCAECSKRTFFNGVWLNEVICKPSGKYCLMCQGRCTQRSIEIQIGSPSESYELKTGCVCCLFSWSWIIQFLNVPCWPWSWPWAA